jgi:membrane-bound metal-dependent hydrolase YbcI (DUF457 family)
MFAVGHMALGYLLSKPAATKLKTTVNIPTALVLSIIPDIDILAGEGFHRGPTHSIIAATLVFIPLFYIYRKNAVPYFLALISHMIGDVIVGGQIQLLWPIYQKDISISPPLPYISITSTTNIALEFILFTAATIVMYKTADLQAFLRPHKSNLLLTIPVATVLLPTFLAYPLTVPIALIPPHVFYLVLFTVSIIAVIFHAILNTVKRKKK